MNVKLRPSTILFALVISASPLAIAVDNAQSAVQQNEQIFRQECLKIDSIYWIIPELRTDLKFDCSDDKVWRENQTVINTEYHGEMLRDSSFRELQWTISPARTHSDNATVTGGATLMQEISLGSEKPGLETLKGYSTAGQFEAQ